MAMKMCVVVPSRGRPENAERLAQAFKDTNTEADLYIVIDNDDPKWNEYAKSENYKISRVNQEIEKLRQLADKSPKSVKDRINSKIEHASHFYSAGKHTALRFNEDNVHGSCLQCNYFKHGNLIPYRINLEHRIGKERLDLLDGLASRLVHKWSILELQTIENEYKDKIKSGCGRI